MTLSIWTLCRRYSPASGLVISLSGELPKYGSSLSIRSTLYGVASLLAIPAVGSVYPVPPAPVMYFPYLFLAYLAVGIVWILSFYRRRPSASVTIRRDLQLAHDRFIGPAAAAE